MFTLFPRFLQKLSYPLFLCISASSALSYWTETYSWTQDPIVMQLGLGPTTVSLQDGTGTCDGSAANALAIWNQYLETIQFQSVYNSNVTQMSGDSFNSVFFSSTVFGEDFGDGVLAVTVYLLDQRVEFEADVIVNQAYDFNSYRGHLQDPVYDIHRIFLHEFGHVLGLGHPDEHGMCGESPPTITGTWIEHPFS